MLFITITSPSGADTLSDPDADSVALLAQYLAGETPNFREEALSAYEYRSANEFDKPSVLNRLEESLRARYTSMAAIDAINFRTRSRFGDYDAAAGVYRIELFAPGTMFGFRPYALLFDNAPEFHEWSLPVAEARKIRELSPYGAVIVDITLRPFAIDPTNSQHVRTQIVAMRMFDEASGQLLHQMALPEAAYRPIQAGGGQDAPFLAVQDYSLAGVSLAMSKDEILSRLEDQGFHLYDAGNAVRFSTQPEGLGIGSGSESMRQLLLTGGNLQAIHFGAELDCMDTARIHSCGMVLACPHRVVRFDC